MIYDLYRVTDFLLPRLTLRALGTTLHRLPPRRGKAARANAVLGNSGLTDHLHTLILAHIPRKHNTRKVLSFGRLCGGPKVHKNTGLSVWRVAFHLRPLARRLTGEPPSRESSLYLLYSTRGEAVNPSPRGSHSDSVASGAGSLRAASAAATALAESRPRLPALSPARARTSASDFSTLRVRL